MADTTAISKAKCFVSEQDLQRMLFIESKIWSLKNECETRTTNESLTVCCLRYRKGCSEIGIVIVVFGHNKKTASNL